MHAVDSFHRQWRLSTPPDPNLSLHRIIIDSERQCVLNTGRYGDHSWEDMPPPAPNRLVQDDYTDGFLKLILFF